MRWAIIFIVLLCVDFSAAQSTQPVSRPSTQPIRRAFMMPPGFKQVEEANYTLLVEPGDAQWIHDALQSFTPATRPTTLPVDLISNLNANEPAIKAQMIKQLALPDGAEVDRLFKDVVLPLLGRYSDLKPPVVFFVTTREKLQQIVLAGWTDPRFRYNKAAATVEVSHGIALSIDAPMDDIVVPVILPSGSKVELKRFVLANQIRALDEDLCVQIANRAQAEMQLSVIAFCSRQVFDPLKLAQDQQWLSMGTAAVLSSHFVQPIDGVNADEFVAGLSKDREDNPIRAVTIDLLHPTPVDQLRPQAIPAYSDAYQRRAIRAVSGWISKAGLEAPAKVITALRKKPAANGKELLAVIKAETGVDLTSALKAGD